MTRSNEHINLSLLAASLRCMRPPMALFHRWCTEQSTEKVEWISDVPFRVRSSTVSLWGMKRRAANLVTTPGFDPNVWTGGALQEGSVRQECSGLAPMYPAFGWSRSAPGHHGCKRALDLTSEQASSGYWGHQFWIALGRPLLHLFLSLSQTSVGNGVSSLHDHPLYPSISLVRPRRRLSPAPTARMPRRRAQSLSRLTRFRATRRARP